MRCCYKCMPQFDALKTLHATALHLRSKELPLDRQLAAQFSEQLEKLEEVTSAAIRANKRAKRAQ